MKEGNTKTRVNVFTVGGMHAMFPVKLSFCYTVACCELGTKITVSSVMSV